MSVSFIFATNNQHKVEELNSVIGSDIHILSLREAGIVIDIPEPWSTLQENAREKALTIYNLTNQACFSEDSGLEVASLGGEPGVHSARYAGKGADAAANMNKLLIALKGEQDRRARFRTVIALCEEGEVTYFEGCCDGIILEKTTGNSGFGYDPIFVPDGGDGRSFGEMTLSEKNYFSHRRKAVDKLIAHLTGR